MAHRAQQGAALVVALILLIVITLVGLASIGGTIMQNKAAANQYDRQLAFQSAEAALRQAAVAIGTATAGQKAPAGFNDCSATAGNQCVANPFDDPALAGNIVTVSGDAFEPGSVAAAQPQYIVQYLGKFIAPTPSVRRISNSRNYNAGSSKTLVDYYRITARSGDPDTVGERAVVVLQTTYRN